MKTALACTALCALVATTAAYDEVTACPYTEFVKLAPLAQNPSLEVCQTASGWQMLPPTGYPTAEQRKLMCETPDCFTLIDAIKELNPSDCVLVFNDVRLNVKKLAEEFEASCFSRR